MKYIFLLLTTFVMCNVGAQDSLKVEFIARKANSKLQFIDQVVVDTTGVITTTRIPIKDSLVAVSWIKLNEDRIDSIDLQITQEFERLAEMENILRQQYEELIRQRKGLIERRKNDQRTKRELNNLKGKL